MSVKKPQEARGALPVRGPIPGHAWLVALLCGAIGFAGWMYADRQVRDQGWLRLSREMDHGVAKLQERLLLCESVVHGAQGLYAASKSVERREWKVYAQGLFQDQNYPGIRALLSISYVPHSSLGSYLAGTRGDEAPDFAIQPAGERRDYCPVKFIQSKGAGSELIGRDVSLIPGLRDTLEQARDSGQFTLSGPVRLTAGPGEPAEVLLILPVYRNDAPRGTLTERRAALEAWVAALLSVGDVMAGISSVPGAQTGFDLLDDRASPPLLFASGANGSVPEGAGRDGRVRVGGRTWRVVCRTTERFTSMAERVFPVLVLAGGGFVGVLGFYLLWSLASIRASALAMASEMTQTLRERERQLVDASRQAGMAEVATGVLHNVGNVLNSVNVSVNVVLEHVRRTKPENLKRVAAMLREHEDEAGSFLKNDPKGRQIPAFLEAFAQYLADEQALLGSEVQGLQSNVEHIKEIVAMQQSFARVSGARELHAPSDMMEDALRISASGLDRHQIEVVRDFQPVPLVLVDRHMVMQILVNLMNNAKQALDQRPEGRRLILGIRAAGDDRVVLEVADNGVGITPENLTRIFQHGFTTKKTGHGFGLHSGANAAREMGGALQVTSEGPGKGATFRLELPVGVARNPVVSENRGTGSPTQAAA